MKYLHLKACLIPLLCFPLVALSFEQERVDNAALKLISAHAQIIFELDKTKFKPVSEFSRTIIDEIYKVHNLALEESSNLKFFVYDHESMLPDSAVSQKRILFEKRLSTVMYVLSKDPKNKEEFILLSPGLHKLIEQAKPHIKFTTLTVVDLLTMHEQRSNFLKKLPQTPEENEQLLLKARARALKLMRPEWLEYLKNELKDHENDSVTELFQLTILEIERRKTLLSVD